MHLTIKKRAEQLHERQQKVSRPCLPYEHVLNNLLRIRIFIIRTAPNINQLLQLLRLLHKFYSSRER